MADRIAVMDRGAVKQVAPPADLYEFPNSRFVADFIGRMNLFEARVLDANADQLVLDVDGIGTIEVPGAPDAKKASVGVAVRPEKTRISGLHPGDGQIAIEGVVEAVAYQGNESHVVLDLGDGARIAATLQNSSRTTAPVASIGDRLWASWAAADTLVLSD